MKKILFIILLIFSNSICNAQIDVIGRVFGKIDRLGLPGANVVEIGTENGTTTDMDGNFSLKVSKPNAVLKISFIGYISEDYSLKGEESIIIYLKEDCIKDFFDSQSISIYALSGVLNNPIGGELDFAFPNSAEVLYWLGFHFKLI